MTSSNKNRGRAQATLRAIRRDTEIAPAISGHLDAVGLPVPDSGNDQAPYAWLAPFQETPSLWLEDETIPIEHAITAVVDLNSALEPLDVADFRILTVTLNFHPGVEGSFLSIVPLVGRYDSDPNDPAAWTPLSLAGPTVSDLTGVGGAAPFTQTFSSRQVQATELRSAVATAALEEIVLAIDFEISGYERVRLSLADPGVDDPDDAGFITVRYARHV